MRVRPPGNVVPMAGEADLFMAVWLRFLDSQSVRNGFYTSLTNFALSFHLVFKGEFGHPEI